MVFVSVVACGARAAPAIADTEGWTWPVAGPVITPYLNDNARPYAGGMHRGIDIAAPVGTKVVAARTGSVTYAGSLGSSGLTVAIATSDGAYVTSYLHLSQISVKRGDTVDRDDEVGAVGTTGTRSAGEPHLHFGVRRADQPDSYVDPQWLLPSPSPQTRAVPPASVPARDQVRAGPAPAAIPPTLTVPLGRPLRTVPVRAGKVPAGSAKPIPMPRVVPAPEHLASTGPAIQAVPVHARSWSGPAPEAAHPRGRAPATHGAYAPPPRRLPLAAPQAAREPAGSGWGRLLTLAGLAIVAAAIAGRRLIASSHGKLQALARLRGKRSQPGPRPPSSTRNRLAGVSQVS
jgi:hypothetical protein